MIYDIHIAADVFLDDFSNRIRNMHICYTDPVNIGIGDDVFLDRVDFKQPRLEGGLEIVQPMLIRWVTISALKAAGGNEAAGVEYTCDIHIKCKIENGSFKTSLGDIVFNDAWPVDIAKYFENFIVKSAFIPPSPVELPLAGIAIMAGLPPDTIPVVGVNATEGKLAVVIRIEYSAVPNIKAWAEFNSGQTKNQLGPNIKGNFCVFMDVATLLSRTEHDLRESLSAKMTVNSVSCRWQPDATGGIIHITADTTLIDLCPGLLGLGAVDVDVEITAQTRLSIVGNNVLELNTTYDWDADNWDSFRCAALLSLDALIAGLVGSVVIGPVMSALSGAVTIGILIAIGPIAANYPVEVPAKPNCVSREKQEICTMNLNVNAPSGPVKFSHASGNSEGLMLFGASRHDRLVSRPIIDSFNISSLGAKVLGDCKNTQIRGSGGVILRYRRSDNLTVMVPVEICKSYVMNKASYQPDYNPDNISVEYSLVPGKTPAEPCLIFFQTNAGTRIFDLGTPSQMTPEIDKQLKLQMQLKKDVCDKMHTTWANPFGQALLKYKDWKQPVETDKEVVLWKVVLAGGHDGDLIKLSGNAKPVGESVVTNGVAEIGVILPLAHSDIALSIERKANMTDKETVQATGTLLRPQGTFDIGFAPTKINFVKNVNGLNLEVSDGRRHAMYATSEIALLSTLANWKAGEPLVQTRKQGLPMRIGKLAFEQAGKTLSIRAIDVTRPAITVNDVQEGTRISEAESSVHKNAFLLWSEAGGELRAGSGANVISRFQSTPWLAGLTQRGKLVAKVDGTKVTLYQVSGLFREQIGSAALAIQKP